MIGKTEIILSTSNFLGQDAAIATALETGSAQKNGTNILLMLKPRGYQNGVLKVTYRK